MRPMIAMLLLGLSALHAPVRAHEAGMRVLVFGDPQVKSPQDVDYYRRDIVEPLRGRHDAQLGITLGDLVDDAPAMHPAVKAETARLGIPWLHAPGNHDLDPGAVDDAGSLGGFRREVGPDTLVRETALANFVVLDDVIAMPGRKPAYIGGFREDQFALLEAPLVLATLAQRYRLHLAERHDVEPWPLITLRPRSGMSMIIERRSGGG